MKLSADIFVCLFARVFASLYYVVCMRAFVLAIMRLLVCIFLLVLFVFARAIFS